MDPTVPAPVHHAPDHPHDDHHHELHWFWRYVFSSDHKVIGLQYGITGLIFLLVGFALMLVMRWQLAHPGTVMPVLGPILASIPVVKDQFPGGVLSADGYNS